MKMVLTPADRLIVAADFKPGGLMQDGASRDFVKAKVLALADSLKGTGVYLKVNSALRACGYSLIGEIQSRGLRVFADLKLYDIPETLSTDGALLREARPELLTTVCSAGLKAMKTLKAELPETEVLGVTVLTSVEEIEVGQMFSMVTILDNVCKFARIASEAGIGGIICAPTEARWVRERIKEDMTINTPAVRPIWAIVPGDDQNPDRIMTPAKAIANGADRIVVGRPIVLHENPYDAVMRTIEEIASVTERAVA